MVRLADAAGGGWDELNQALLKDKGLRGRLFAVLGSSLALGDHLVANPAVMAPAGRQGHLAAGRRVAHRLCGRLSNQQRAQAM